MAQGAIGPGIFLFGAVIGSFVGLVADRWPRCEPMVATRSRCRGCGRRLSPAELVPIASYALQRGRCRACGAAIGGEALAAEIGGGVVSVLAWISTMDVPGALALALAGWALLLLALLDWRCLWLPDLITLPLMTAGVASALVLPGHEVVDRLAGAAFGYASLTVLRLGYRWLRGHEGMGAGDAKLLGAIGAWLGLASLAPVVLGAALAGLALAAIMAFRGRRDVSGMRLPLGTFLAVSALAAIPVFA